MTALSPHNKTERKNLRVSLRLLAVSQEDKSYKKKVPEGGQSAQCLTVNLTPVKSQGTSFLTFPCNCANQYPCVVVHGE